MAVHTQETDQAREALLQRITAMASGEGPINGPLVLQLAEAYAWLAAPNQPHGASAEGFQD